jgi:HAD superfamily hydrolase (TIGR01490 family)
VLGKFLAGLPEVDLCRLGESFANGVLPGLVRPAALTRIAWHREQGHRLVLVSASLEAYLEPWGRQAGFDDILATRLESINGRLTGRFAGPNCRDAEKVVRLRELVGPIDGVVLHAYGDSRGDRELLAVADHPHFKELSPS